MQRQASSSPKSSASARLTAGALRGGLATGLLPLAPLAGITILALALAAPARQLLAGQGFFAQQQAAVIVITLGLAAAAASYTVLCVRALRRVREWQQTGEAAQAAQALWALGGTALVVLLPLLLAILLPQHPAP
jgi:hypothetical protein